ncbi:hypothetical protein BQ8482_190038 [Mesorhizobium delmotii]|uniref:Uncharacterized protein n=1 Tax=Mesorhizobium delmotii TaxID=1631247 RepID=A0A2P9AJI6_9HYPH|nr:hypothetical protein BQ8482_190038 [Mesorhizobium delmotii]
MMPSGKTCSFIKLGDVIFILVEAETKVTFIGGQDIKTRVGRLSRRRQLLADRTLSGSLSPANEGRSIFQHGPNRAIWPLIVPAVCLAMVVTENVCA